MQPGGCHVARAPPGPKEVMALDSTENLNETTQLLIGEGRFSEAIPHLEKVVGADSCDVQDAVHLACSYQQVGNHEAAIDLFEQILPAEELIPADRVALHERLGYCLLAAHERERAAAAFEKAISLDENASRSNIGLGLCMVETGRTGDARRLFERALEIYPDCADAYSNLGVLAWTELNLDEALAHFKRALEIEPTHKDALPNLLTLLFALESYEAAESLLQSYLDAAPDNRDLAYQLAYSRLKLGRPDEARALLQEILETDPGREDALALLAECTTE